MFGASLLSAAASLPSHLMPLLLVAVLADGRLVLPEAGWITSTYLLGQMTTTLGLPALGFRRITRGQAFVAAGGFVALLLLSIGLAGFALLSCWWAMGAACGGLQFLATTTAANAQNRADAFSLRLAISLVLSGSMILCLQWLRGFGSYGPLALQLAPVIALILFAGLCLYRPPVPQDQNARASSLVPSQEQRPWGLVAVFVLFAGQTGIMAYAVQAARHRGLALEHATFALGICKLAAGVALFISMKYLASESRQRLGPPGVVLALAVAGMVASTDTLSFMVSLLLWELGINVLSARLQPLVVQENPRIAGAWLTGALFVGGAAGPALHGASFQFGMPELFQVFAIVSALVPAAWAVSRAMMQPRLRSS